MSVVVAAPRKTVVAGPKRYTVWNRLASSTLRQPLILSCLVFIALITLIAIVVPLLPLQDPDAQSFLFRLKPPSGAHWLGTDRLGRDILARVFWSARISLFVGVGVVVLSGIAGTVLGMIGGYFSGWFSSLIMRLIDILLAFPPLILALVLVTVLGNNVFTVILAISVGALPRFTRIAQGSILSIRERGYVEAARALGATNRSIMLRHVLLNAVDPLIVISTFLIPLAIILEATLSFIGVGVTEPTPTWGNMISSGQIVLVEAPWLTLFPALAIGLTVLAFNLFGDAVRDALDPSVVDLDASHADAPRPARADAAHGLAGEVIEPA
ncbi:MAG: ABC transporter permease [Chloroflexota bacterium]